MHVVGDQRGAGVGEGAADAEVVAADAEIAANRDVLAKQRVIERAQIDLVDRRQRWCGECLAAQGCVPIRAWRIEQRV